MGQHPEESMLSRVGVYLSFLEHARTHRGGFHNFMDYQRNWLDAEGTGDCQGQAVRSLAEVLGSNLPEGYRAVARELIEAVMPTLADLRSLRAQAYVILAWGHLWTAGVKDIEPLESIAWSAARRIGRVLRAQSTARLALVRVAHDLCQRGAAACPVCCRAALAERTVFSKSRQSHLRIPRPLDDGRQGLLAGRERWVVRTRRGQGRRTTSNRSKPS